MKKIISSVLVLALVCACVLLMFPVEVQAIEPLDEIQDYTICVDMRNDGTMDIKYHIEWKVLDSTSEGPLSWVEIGIPNKHLDELKALTSNIKDIQYDTRRSGGELLTFARIDFDRDYKAGEVLTFEFSLHQSNMYVIEEDAHRLRYSFTPGWFDEIQVKKITIKWDADNILEMSGQPNKDDEYYIWTDTLDYGERFNISIYYNLDVFDATEEGQYKEPEEELSLGAILVIIIIVFLIIMFLMFLFDDGYGSGSGFSGTRYHSTHVYHSHRSSCACVSSCACACACAGGGRAGCSAKDFYGTNLRSDDLMEVLKEEM